MIIFSCKFTRRLRCYLKFFKFLSEIIFVFLKIILIACYRDIIIWLFNWVIWIILINLLFFRKRRLIFIILAIKYLVIKSIALLKIFFKLTFKHRIVLVWKLVIIIAVIIKSIIVIYNIVVNLIQIALLWYALFANIR